MRSDTHIGLVIEVEIFLLLHVLKERWNILKMYKECDSSVGDDNESAAGEQSQSKPEAAATVQSEKIPHRKRKKNFFNKIRTQMEFYFGDANLSKDRFLNKLLAENDCK